MEYLEIFVVFILWEIVITLISIFVVLNKIPDYYKSRYISDDIIEEYVSKYGAPVWFILNGVMLYEMFRYYVLFDM